MIQKQSPKRKQILSILLTSQLEKSNKQTRSEYKSQMFAQF